ncbi:MAG TPA: hypothetical protein VIV59_06600 [Anaeromyxobacteraceae bacterium]
MTTPTALASKTLPSLALALLLAVPAAARAEAPSGQAHEGHAMPAAKAPAKRPSPAAAQLEKLKALAGTWTGKAAHGDSPGDDTSATWRVTAAGSAVVETIAPGTPHEMVTVYHLDGDHLVLTHYCAAGNQPTMRARPSKDASIIAFDFVRGSNMRPGDMHMHSLRIALAGEDRLETEWTTWSGGKAAGSAKFALARQK